MLFITRGFTDTQKYTHTLFLINCSLKFQISLMEAWNDSSFYQYESTTISFIRGKRTTQKRGWNKDSNCIHFIGKGPQKS